MLILKNTSGGPVIAGRYRYYQFETRTAIGPFNTFRQLLAEIRLHRKSNNIPIGTDFENEISAWICRNVDPDVQAEFCMDSESRRSPSVPARRESPTGFDGSRMWAQLHRHALMTSQTGEARAFWLADWAKGIPCGTCKRGWRQISADNPLDKNATPAEFFEWTVKVHSLISEKIGKPSLTVEQARDIWLK